MYNFPLGHLSGLLGMLWICEVYIVAFVRPIFVIQVDTDDGATWREGEEAVHPTIALGGDSQAIDEEALSVVDHEGERQLALLGPDLLLREVQARSAKVETELVERDHPHED